MCRQAGTGLRERRAAWQASEGRALVGVQSRARCLPVLPAAGGRRASRLVLPWGAAPSGGSWASQEAGGTGRGGSEPQPPWEVAWPCRTQPLHVALLRPSCCFVGPLAGVVSLTGTKCLPPPPPGQAVAAACAPAPSLSPCSWARGSHSSAMGPGRWCPSLPQVWGSCWGLCPLGRFP